MPQPYDYTMGNVPDPATSFMQGLQRGVGMQQLDVQRQQQQLAMQAEAQKMEQQRARAAAMQALMDNPAPTADDYRKAMTAAPDLSEDLKRGWEVLNTEQQQSALNDAGQVYAALESGKPEYAIKSLRDRVEAMKTGGGNPQQIKAVEDMAALIEMDPATAKRSIGMRLATAPGGDKVMSALATLGGEQRSAAEAPAKLAKAEAEAKTAGVTAKFAESQAVADLEKKGWDVKAIQADIGYKRESNRIAAMNAAAAQMNARGTMEGNDLKRQELKLKIEDTIKARDTAVRERASEFDSRIAGVVDARSLIREIKDSGGLSMATGITASSSVMPGSDARTAAGKIEQLQSVLAAENLDKLKGAMSDKDIMFLKNIASNLDRWQGTDKFTAELDKVDAALARGDAAVRKKYGAPAAVQQSNPAAPAAPAAKGGPTVSGW